MATGTPENDRYTRSALTTETSNETEVRHQPPIRWPHPDGTTLGLVALWVVGLALALLVPALIVSPTARTAPPGQAWAAFGCTFLGCLVMFGVSLVMWRRNKDAAVLVFGGVPAIACLAGGIILATAKVTGT